VYGDTNSTLAGALSAVKLQIPAAHLEAGLRSFNRRMPEEHNRVLTDHACDLLLAPTAAAAEHLAEEGLAGRTVIVGDVMVDACLRARDLAVSAGAGPAGAGPAAAPAEGIDPAEPYVVATVHRPHNTDDPARLAAIVDALAALPVPVALLAHPRLTARAAAHGIELRRGSIRLGVPLPYAQTIAAVLGSAGVVTDSGGLQKEAYQLGRVCTTLRAETEWPETLAEGWNVLLPFLEAGSAESSSSESSSSQSRSPEPGSAAGLAALAARRAPTVPPGSPYGDGRAAVRVVSELERASTREPG
jgi:UDP-N-acetylglucosamine 2-epimerase (non-hydrolysing)